MAVVYTANFMTTKTPELMREVRPLQRILTMLEVPSESEHLLSATKAFTDRLS